MFNTIFECSHTFCFYFVRMFDIRKAKLNFGQAANEFYLM